MPSNIDTAVTETNQPVENSSRPVFLQTYPGYPASEDIYEKSSLDPNIDPADPSIHKINDEPQQSGETNEINDLDDLSGDDLDVPGSELDDAEEATGNEDEENNLYSLGGDNHDAS